MNTTFHEHHFIKINKVSKKIAFFMLSLLTVYTTVQAQTQNSIWSLPPNYVQYSSIFPFPPSSPQPLPAPGVVTPFSPLGVPNYAGQQSEFVHNAMQDKEGNLLFFIVDGVIYDSEGYGINVLDEGSLFKAKGYSEVVIIPVPGNCQQYFIVTPRTKQSQHPFSGLAYALLDMSANSVSSGRKGILIAPTISGLPNNEAFIGSPTLFNLDGQAPNFSTTSDPESKISMAVTQLRSDNTRLLFAVGEFSLFRFKVTSTGIFYDNYFHTLAFPNNLSITEDNIRSEMEIINTNSGYRIAFGYPSSIGATVFIGELDNIGNLTSNSTFSLQSTINSTLVPTVKGLEFSPNGNYLYSTHDPTIADPFPFKIYDVLNAMLIPVNHAGIVNQIAAFKDSQIELGKDGKLYLANSTSLATIGNSNNPNSLTWNNSAASISYNLSDLGFPTNPIENKLYLLPDQIDGMDYAAHFTATPECCLTFTTLDVQEDKNNQAYFGNQTWSAGATNNPFGSINGTVTVKDILIIKNGANITINNMRFEFAPGARLIVENGAKLTINGTTLTVYTGCGGTGLMWRGVEVWGQPGFQGFVSGSFTAQSNSLIEHALEGVVNFKRPLPLTAGGSAPNTIGFNGGIIRSTNSTFRNNVQDVVFNPYTSTLNGLARNDLSFFTRTTFITDNSLNNAAFNNSITHVTLNSVTGINFTACTFTNTAPVGIFAFLSKGRGIIANNTKFTVRGSCTSTTFPCQNFTNSVFNNLTIGVRSVAVNRAQTATITNATFFSNWRSIYLKGMDVANVSDNAVNVGASFPNSLLLSYGLYLDNCSGYKVENNNFTTSFGGFLGVYVNNSGTANNEIYRNTFSNLVVASQSAQINGNGLDFGKGLEFRCNQYATISDYDILISSGLLKDDHGLCGNVLAPANNRFSYTATGDFWATPNSLGTPTYRYSPQGSFNLMPRNNFFNIQNTAEQVCINLPAFNPATSCPKRVPLTKTQLSAALSNMRITLDSLTGLIDAGSTATLLNIIATQSGGNVKNALLAASPYLSDEVLLAFLASHPANGHLQQILLANSPLSEAVAAYLATMNVPKGIKNQITNAQTGVSAMELLSQEIAFTTNEIARTENDLIRELLFDEVSNDGFKLVEDFLMQNTSRTNEQEQLLALVRIANQDSTAARTQLNRLDSNVVNADFCKLHNVVIDVMNRAEGTMALATDTARVALVGEVANASTSRQEVANAQSLLEGIGARIPYNETIEIVAPQTGNLRLGSTNSETNTANTQESIVALYPNPAGNQLTITHNLTTENGAVSLQIMDVMGRVLISKTINNSTNTIEINNLSSGLYFFTILQNGNVVESGKLVVE